MSAEIVVLLQRDGRNCIKYLGLFLISFVSRRRLVFTTDSAIPTVARSELTARIR